ncbi:phage tail fiber protein, partial [Acinetobacter baumannii]
LYNGEFCYKTKKDAEAYSPTYTVKSTKNTTIDANGFLKSASPVVKLFKDHIELNSDAEKQPIEFKKVDVGDYLLKGSLGFAQEGWYIEVPKDANGNTIVAVVYDTLENGDLSIK